MFFFFIFFKLFGSLNFVGLFFILELFKLLGNNFVKVIVKFVVLIIKFLDGIRWVKNVLFIIFNFFKVLCIFFCSNK